MVIIIEGIDRVGKTTLAKRLSRKLNIPIFKKERIAGNEADDLDTTLINYGNATGLVDMWNWSGFTQDIIVDRFHWTEAVYGKIERHNSSPEFMSIVESRMELKKEKYLVILMVPTDIEWSSEQHGKDLSEHNEMFRQLFIHSKLEVYCGNYNTIDDIVAHVGNRLRMEKEYN